VRSKTEVFDDPQWTSKLEDYSKRSITNDAHLLDIKELEGSKILKPAEFPKITIL